MDTVDERQFWTADKVNWLKIASQTPDRKAPTHARNWSGWGKTPGLARLAEMASEQFGVKLTPGQIRNAVRRFIKQGEFPVDHDQVLAKIDFIKTFALGIANTADSLRSEIERERLEAFHKR